MTKPRIQLLEGRFDIYRLPSGAAVPETVLSATPVWLARTEDEVSIVCRPNADLASRAEVSVGWAAIKVLGPIEHTVVGLLADISAALAAESITLFAQSTFDTDYILVRSAERERALTTLASAGYELAR